MSAGQEPCILIATEAVDDAELVRSLLASTYPDIHLSTKPERFAEDFDRHRPQIVVLAFKTLEAAERYYLGLHRQSALVHDLPHRTLILCRKEDVGRVYALCCRDFFDDYVLFWPMVHDAPRLPMSVRLAVKALSATRTDVALSQLATQARRIADLERQLERQLAFGHARTDDAVESVGHARARVHAVLDDPPAGTPVADGGLTTGVSAVESATVRASLHDAVSSIAPIRQWIGALKDELAGPLEAAQSITRQLEHLPPVVLVVDDDAFMRKLLARVLTAARYEVDSSATIVEMMSRLRTRRPDLIMMDVGLPGTDGIQGTRRLKSFAAFADIPVIMLTGGSGQVVVDSLGAGAVDFVVKPFDRESLLKKVEKRVGGS